VALLAEWVAATELDCEPNDDDTAAATDLGPFGPICLDEQGMFQLIDLARLLPPDRRLAVFGQEAETGR
jgi:hypothetical protein